MKTVLLICLLCLPASLLAEEVQWQPDARTIAEYKKFSNEYRQKVLVSLKEILKREKLSLRDIRRAPITGRTEIDGVDRYYIGFADASAKNRVLNKALADVKDTEEAIKKIRDKSQPYFAPTDEFVRPGRYYDPSSDMPISHLKLNSIYKMSRPQCRIVDVIDSDSSLVVVNWEVALGGGQIEPKTTKVILRKRPTTGMTDGGVVKLDMPLYVATTEKYCGETLFVLVPIESLR